MLDDAPRITNSGPSSASALREARTPERHRHGQSYSTATKGVSLGTNIVAIAQGMYFMNMDR